VDEGPRVARRQQSRRRTGDTRRARENQQQIVWETTASLRVCEEIPLLGQAKPRLPHQTWIATTEWKCLQARWDRPFRLSADVVPSQVSDVRRPTRPEIFTDLTVAAQHQRCGPGRISRTFLHRSRQS